MLVQRKQLILLASMTLVLAVPAPAPAQNFFFKDGDRIVVMGDSITEQHLYSNYLEMWTVSRFPAWKLTFRNVGIGGDRSLGGNSRFQRDVVAHQATALTVDFGMNDGGYRPFDKGHYDSYMKGLQGIADQAKKAGMRVAYITPQPIERREPGKQLEGYNITLEKFSAGVKEIADKNDGLFVDQFHPYLAAMAKARETNPKIIVTGGDAVHPGPPGQALMAASILKGMNFPRLVSRVKINLQTRKILINPSNGAVKNMEVLPEGAGLKFDRQDKALPFFPPDAKNILPWAPILEEMNDYGLQIIGLKAGAYEIHLGGKKVAQHSDAELAKGVNLAAAVLAVGPIADQVKDVWQAVTKKNRYFHDKIYRGVVLAGNNQKLYEERMQKMPELDAAVRQALTMRSYQVAVVPVKN